MNGLTAVVLMFAEVGLCAEVPKAEVRTLCELLQAPASFDGKRVQVGATHRYGFEFSEVYCLGCANDGGVFLEIPITVPKREAARLTGHHSLTTNVVVVGRFVASGGPFGHDGTNRYKLVAERFLKIERVAKSSYVPSSLPEDLKLRVCTAPSSASGKPTGRTGPGRFCGYD